MRTLFTVLILFISGITFAQKEYHLYFDIDNDKPLAYSLPSDIEKWIEVYIVASTDYLGDSLYNIDLSRRRAKNVEAILLEQGVEVTNVNWIGETGPIKQDQSGDAKSRRVTVLYKVNPSNENLEEKVEELKVGESLVLKNLNFIPGYALLIDSARESVVQLLYILKEHPNLKISIEGHICCQNDPNHPDGLNHATGVYDLSEARAKYIYEFLVMNGVARDRMTYKGFAKRKPIYPEEKNPNEEQANRRVEIRVLEK